MNAVHIRILHLPAVRRVAAIENGTQFALGNALRVVIAPRDAAAHLGEQKIDLVLAKFGFREHPLERLKDRADRFLQGRKTHGRAGLAEIAFHRRSHVFEFFIELIAGLGARSARAHNLGRNFSQPVFVRRIEKISGANQGEAVDDRQFVVLQQEDAHAV